jgi:hypothetical protein
VVERQHVPMPAEREHDVPPDPGALPEAGDQQQRQPRAVRLDVEIAGSHRT